MVVLGADHEQFVDNLMRHLKKHKKVDATNHGVPCKWAGCESSPCTSEVEWANHVDVHLEEVKEILGLGPAALTSGNTPVSVRQITLANVKFQNKDHVPMAPFSGDYLCQAGTQVTPRARPGWPPMTTTSFRLVVLEQTINSTAPVEPETTIAK
jgi:hypothetical protein